MKKLLTMILALALILPAAAMADPDVKSMTDQQLRDLISACSAELQARATTPEGWVLLVESESVQLYQIGEAMISDNQIITIPVAVVNNSDIDVRVEPEDILLNGWEIDCWGAKASANSKKKGELEFFAYDSDVKSLEDVSSFVFRFEIRDNDYNVLYKDEAPAEHRFW